MAHADYNCCAVCDCKLEYSEDSQTKETVCMECMANLYKHGVMIKSVNGLIDWITATPKRTIRKVLKDIGFRRCYYTNEVDDEVIKKGIKFKDDRSIK